MNEKINELTSEEQHIILGKGTEKPFSGKYTEHLGDGVYCCKQCDATLYRSEHKFRSQCGWPSFDDEVSGAVKRQADADGLRTEIVCAQCDGHLGHVFEGEYLTVKNIRHCVNSISMKFSTQEECKAKGLDWKKAYFGGGCFWGVEHLMQQQSGVVSVVSGYMGGHLEDPSYQQVCKGDTGHIEVVEVLYDSDKVSFEILSQLFFEIHDATQDNGQGPDKGSQYVSAIFYTSESEKETSEKLIQQLTRMGLIIATSLIPVSIFWKAEEDHQDYYEKQGKVPYCHRRQKIFFDEND